jgi:tetratricopeptide (TPR) repeat protein
MHFSKYSIFSFLFFTAIGSHNIKAQTAADTVLATRYGDTAEVKMNAGDYKGAITYYTKQIKSPLRLGTFYYNRANAESFLSQYDNSAKDYDSALRLDTTLGLAYMNQAYMYMQLHKTKEAFADYEKGLKAVKDSQSKANMYVSRGNAYMNLGNLAEAENDLTNGLRYNAYSWQGWYQRGAVRRKLKKLKPALEDLNRANVLKPGNHDIILVRGITKYELEMYKPAVADLNTALKLEKSIDGYYFRGLAKLKLGEDSLAREDFTKILATDKKNIVALNGRAEANFKLKHPKLSLKDYSTSLPFRQSLVMRTRTAPMFIPR